MISAFFSSSSFFSNPYVLGNSFLFQNILYSIYFSGVILFLPLLCISSTRILNNLLLTFFSSLFLFLVLFSFSKSLWFFFFVYEFFFFPSFVIIFFSSPNTRFWSALIYFTVWTQVGSLLVMLFFVSFYNNSGLYAFDGNCISPSFFEGILVLFGLGIKIPIWPFHFWLTNTHVEAPSFFSIYLSGFLVNTAVLGFCVVIDLLDSLSIFIGIFLFVIGCIDSTLKFICQVDLKKLVAYTTIQEMNMIMLLFFLTKTYYLVSISVFVVLHTLLSTLFFFIVDLLYNKYRSSVSTNVSGVLNTNYTFGIFIIVSVVLFNALPFTVKFFIEIQLFLNILDFSYFSFFLLCFIVNCFGSIFFFNIWSCILFGSSVSSYSFSLNSKEFIFFLIYLSVFILLSFFI